MRLCADEPDSASAVRTLSRFSKPTILAICWKRFRSVGIKIEHRRAMAEDARVDIDDDIAAGLLLGHLVDPALGLDHVDLNAQARGGVDDARDRVVHFCVRQPSTSLLGIDAQNWALAPRG